MTLNGAIMQLVELSEHPMMPVIFRPLIQKVIETISELEENPEPHWHPVSEQPQEEDDYLLLTHEKFKHGTFKRIIIGAWNNATKEWLEEYGDMYRAVNHPVAWISKEELLLLKGYEV